MTRSSSVSRRDSQRVGDAVPDEVEPPADLEQRVARVRNRRRGMARFTALSAAAIVVVAVATVAVVARPSAPARNRVDVNGRPGPADPLAAGTVMLDSRASFVVAVGADGSQVATLVNAGRGTILDAQLTADHHWLWYLSVAKTKKAGAECGEVVRADITSGNSAIVARAVSFAISPDGSRLALAGGGDFANGRVRPAHERNGARPGRRHGPRDRGALDLDRRRHAPCPCVQPDAMVERRPGDRDAHLP